MRLRVTPSTNYNQFLPCPGLNYSRYGIVNSKRLGYQLWHRPLKMASGACLQKEIGVASLPVISQWNEAREKMKSDWGETGQKFFVTGLAQILFCPRSFVFNLGPGASHPRRIGVLDHWRMNRMRSLKSSMFCIKFSGSRGQVWSLSTKEQSSG